MKHLRALFVGLLITSVLHGAQAYVNCVAVDSGGVSATTQTTAATSLTAGNAVYAIAKFDALCGTDTMTLTDTAGNTWTQIDLNGASAGVLYSDGSGTSCIGAWYAKNVTGNASNVYTLTLNRSIQTPALAVIQFSGSDTSSPLQSGSVATGSANSATSVTTGAFSTTTANSVLLTGLSSYTQNATWTAGTGYTLPAACLSGEKRIAIQYKLVTATQSSVTAGATISSTSWLLAASAALGETPPAVPASVKRKRAM